MRAGTHNARLGGTIHARRGVRTLILLAGSLVYVGYVLARWPWTHGLSRNIAEFALHPLEIIGNPADADRCFDDALPILQVGRPGVKIVPGQPCLEGARNALDALEMAVGLTRSGVANLIFTGPAFADLMTTGELPDRDDFKDRFVAGASALLKVRGRDDFLAPDRDAYTSTPKFDQKPGRKSKGCCQLISVP